jgi:hypothetical protein
VSNHLLQHRRVLHRSIACLSMAGSLSAIGLIPVFAAAPTDVGPVASIEAILLEVDSKIEVLSGALESAEKFEMAKEKDVWQAFGVISVMGQAIAEHPQKADAPFSGPALRDAALQYYAGRGLTYEQAQAAFAAVQEARQGGGATDAAADYEWNKLIRMHPMMEEINSRNAKLLSVFRRPRGRPEEAGHATTIALLSLAMYADTHEVKNEADIPQWQAWATEYREKMVAVAAAVQEKDGAKARELFDAANETCDACHEKFRDVE